MNNLFSLNQHCENALIDFPFHDIVETWIQDHYLLYLKIEEAFKSVAYNSAEAHNKHFIELFYSTYKNNQ